MTNPIQYLQSKGFVVTSDPNHYYQSYNPPRGKKAWGKRDLMSYGINADAFCGGYHRAYDLCKWHDAPIPAIANATVLRGTGWNTFGWTLVLGFKDAKGRAFQVVYGHLNRNPLTYLRIGQNVKQGQIVAYQGDSNNLGVSMASHLHIQFQNYQALNEWNFTCLGIDPLKIDVSKTKPTSGATPKKASKSKAKKKSAGFNKRKGRKTRNRAYARGVIRSTNGKGAALRRYSKGTFKNTFGNDLPDGSVIYIYATTKDGWAKVYSPQNKGWVHLDQVQITDVY